MKFPFTTEQFLDLFRQYNTTVWPMPLILNLLALFMVFAIVLKWKQMYRFLFLVLAFLWLWTGTVYHLLFFTTINPAAYIFGAAFLLQGIFFLTYALGKQDIVFSARLDVYGFTGLLLIVYALVAYPMLGYFLGHRYPAAPSFGLPCPTTIFTLGLLLWKRDKMPAWLFLIPLLWSAIGFSAALVLGMKEDVGLIISAILFIVLGLSRIRHPFHRRLPHTAG